MESIETAKEEFIGKLCYFVFEVPVFPTVEIMDSIFDLKKNKPFLVLELIKMEIPYMPFYPFCLKLIQGNKIGWILIHLDDLENKNIKLWKM